MTPDQPLIELIFNLLADSGLPDEAAELVLAAVSARDDLAAVLAGQPASLDTSTTPADGPPTHVYLRSVTVSGFRGVGPRRILTIPDGPGLTLVVGRNGSGKSSFAEAVELTLTGDSARWADRNSVWRTGWRNLHAPDPCEISTELRIDGQAQPVVVRRSWSGGGDLDSAAVTVTGADNAADLAALGLARPLALYRPFLTAAELGNLVSGTPSRLFDALNAILGLEALSEADRRLRDEANPLDSKIKEVRAQRVTLRDELLAVDDERAQRAADVLTATTPDMDRLAEILAEPIDGAADTTVAACRRLAALTLPDATIVGELSDELRTAAADAQRHAAAATRAAVNSAELLRVALQHHADHGDGACPVCGIGTLDADWRTRATAILNDLQRDTIEAKQATSRLNGALRRARTFIAECVPYYVEPADAPAVAAALTTLRAAAAVLAAAPMDSQELADHLNLRYPAVTVAVEEVRTAASAWLRERDSGWQRIAATIRVWQEDMRRLPDRQQTLARIKAARTWLNKAGEAIRNERLEPFATHSQQIWAELRQDSSVKLGAMTLAGNATRRRVEFPVSVDGADNGTALGVMSQGEMQALGLAVFLPRSCATESPFRFVIIDDPVQSMDPSKVDGLARVLATLAQDRQVVVFTHDSRLPNAVRHLEIDDAHVIEVVRAEQSVITLRPALDPVDRYLDDARAVALTKDVPEDVRGPVVAELCRSALEAACHRVIWRNRLRRGERHADIETLIEESRTTSLKASLALFDDPSRGGDVLGYLNRRHGGWAADAFQACRKGVHGAYTGDLTRMVRETHRLAKELA